MTREQLYNLVWSKPMTHLAKKFGMSDVAIRKHCKKFDIATPYVGYWAKLGHGKRVSNPPLSTKKFSADVSVGLAPRARTAESGEASRSEKEVRDQLELLQSQLVVPDRLSGHLHPLVQLTRERFRQAKPDTHGLLNIGNPYHPSIGVGSGSIQRVLRILSTIMKVVNAKGQTLFEREGKYYWQVTDECFVSRIWETKAKSIHEPTRSELSEQARRDTWSKEHPDWFSTDRKTYRHRDYSPSGRLTLELSDSARYGWGEKHIENRWRDRNTKPLDLCLADVLVWLASAEVIVREKRLKHEQELHIQAVSEEQRRTRNERRQRAQELERFILKHADVQKISNRVSKLLKSIEDRQNGSGWAIPRLIKELHRYQIHLRSLTGESAVSAFLNSLEIDQDTPLLIPLLTTGPNSDDFF